jgi:hypothetical protein
MILMRLKFSQLSMTVYHCTMEECHNFWPCQRTCTTLSSTIRHDIHFGVTCQQTPKPEVHFLHDPLLAVKIFTSSMSGGGLLNFEE